MFAVKWDKKKIASLMRIVKKRKDVDPFGDSVYTRWKMTIVVLCIITVASWSGFKTAASCLSFEFQDQYGHWTGVSAICLCSTICPFLCLLNFLFRVRFIYAFLWLLSLSLTYMRLKCFIVAIYIQKKAQSEEHSQSVHICSQHPNHKGNAILTPIQLHHIRA